MQNLFADVPKSLSAELVSILLETPGVRIERILSTGQASPPGFWYDQTEGEWVIVLKGEAKLQIEGEPIPVHLQPGNHLFIPPGQRHRVEWTTSEVPTIWLAVFVK